MENVNVRGALTFWLIWPKGQLSLRNLNVVLLVLVSSLFYVYSTPAHMTETSNFIYGIYVHTFPIYACQNMVNMAYIPTLVGRYRFGSNT